MEPVNRRIELLYRYGERCPNCGEEAYVEISEYKSGGETLIITTLRCSSCGYKKSEILPILDEDEFKCLEINIEEPRDLNTILHIPPGSTIEVPQLGLRLELAELANIAVGSYITVDGLLEDIREHLEDYCRQLSEQLLDTTNIDRCVLVLEVLKQASIDASIPLTIKVYNSYGNIRVVKTYRDNNKKC